MLDDLTMINNTSVYRNPSPYSPLQGQNVMQPAAVYSKLMLKTIELSEKDYVFDSIAVERTMPANNGANELVFKRVKSLAAHTQPLVEGIPPASDQGRIEAIKGTCTQYGRVMKFTDKVKWAVTDPLISEFTRQLSLKVPETKDILAQEALLAECQMFYSSEKEIIDNDPDKLKPSAFGDINHLRYLNPNCNPTIDEFRKIVLSLEACKVDPYTGSNFLALVSSAVWFDLITDKRVKEYMEYQGTGQPYARDMVLDLFSLAFKKAKTIKTDNTYIDGSGDVQHIYYAPVYTATGDGYKGSANIIAPGNILDLAGTTSLTVVPLDKTEAGVLKAEPFTATKTVIDTATGGGKYDVLNIHYSFVIGNEALFRIGVEGHTAPQFIAKPEGSAGTADPLNQRSSVGWKIDSLGYKVANPDAVVAYVSIPKMYKINVNARPDFKNQFTDYNYGYNDGAGNYYHPEQVMQTVDGGAVKYYVRGTTTEVSPVKMTSLVNPVNGGRLGTDGKKVAVVGTLPTHAYSLKSDAAIRFLADQIVKHSDSKYYIKGLAGTSSAEVLALPQTFNQNMPTGDGQSIVTTTVLDEGVSEYNKTGDPRIDDK